MINNKNLFLVSFFRAGGISLRALILAAALSVVLAAPASLAATAEDKHGTDLTAKPLPVILGVTLNSSVERYQNMVKLPPTEESGGVVYSRAEDAGKDFGGAAVIATAYYAYKNMLREIGVRIAATDAPKITAWLDGLFGPSSLGGDALPQWRAEGFSLHLGAGDSALTREVRIVYDKDTREEATVPAE